MISKIEKKIIFRYLKTKKNDGFINIISIFSFTGISLGVAVLIIVMSVMNGFRTELINKIVGFNAHIIINPNNQNLDILQFKNKELKEISKDFLISSSGEGVIISNNSTKGILLRGYSRKSFQKLILLKVKILLEIKI